MNLRNLAGKKIKPIGFGAMPIDEYGPKTNDVDAISLIQHAAKIGIDLVDTADVYGNGRNETLIGNALTPEEKSNLMIATKAGCIRPNGGWGTDGRPEHIKQAITLSLDRLGIKQIELYQLHAPDKKVELTKTLQAFKELQDSGLIKHFGVSNFDVSQIIEAREMIDVVSVQNHYNMAFKNDEANVLPYVTKEEIPYLPYFPLGGGRVLVDTRLVAISERLGLGPSQVALAWILNKWPTAIPIPGTKKKNHMEENLKAIDIQLDQRTITQLDNMY